MNLFLGYKLEINNNEYNLIVTLNKKFYNTEFSDESGHIDKKNSKILYNMIYDYTKRIYPNIKVNNIKLMIGSMLVATIAFSSIQGSVEASTLNNITITSQDIRIMINNEIQNLPQTPIVINGTTFVPVRAIAEMTGSTVWWNNDSKTVGLEKDNTKIAFIIGASTANVNGNSVSIPTTFVKNGTTFVPIRFVSELMGLKVDWDSANKMVIITSPEKTQNINYTVLPGDSLWKIANTYKVTIDSIKKLNDLSSDNIQIDQKLLISTDLQPVLGLTETVESAPLETSVPTTVPISSNTSSLQIYTVKSGDSLSKIGYEFNVSVNDIKKLNNLSSDVIQIGQQLSMPISLTTHVVKAGENVYSISTKYGMSPQDIIKFNYMTPTEWLDAGETIYLSGYAPRDYTVFIGESDSPARVGQVVDWFREGQYIIKRNDVFTITDVDTGLQFKVKMMGGYNHSDIEPLTSEDTIIMKILFQSWTWTPRAVVIYKDGMNIAGSLAGMPHEHNTVLNNGVTGHFDLYLLNSRSHNTNKPSSTHQKMVYKAAGIK